MCIDIVIIMANPVTLNCASTKTFFVSQICTARSTLFSMIYVMTVFKLKYSLHAFFPGNFLIVVF